MKFSSALAPLFVLFFGQSAFADILFVDFNGSRDELQAVRQAAAKRGNGERVIVVPEIPDPIYRKASELGRAEWNLEKKIEEIERKLEQSADPVDQERLGALKRDAERLGRERAEMLKSYRFEFSDIEEAIRRIEAQNRVVTSLVLSGESGATAFWGELLGGGMDQVSLERIELLFSRYPKSRDAVGSVLLWGCFTGNPEQALWSRSAFPSSTLAMGFSSRGPSGYNAASSSALRSILEKERELARASDTRSVQRVIASLSGATSLSGRVGSCYVNQSQGTAAFMDRLPGDCGEIALSAFEALPEFQSFFKADRGHENPPRDVSASPLRDFYSKLQRASHCEVASDRLPPREKVLALIFFENVRQSFARYFAPDLRKAKKFLASCPASVKAVAPDPLNPNVSRRELLTQVASLNSFLESAEYWKCVNPEGSRQMPSPEKAREFRAQVDQLRKMHSAAKTILADLSCVPPMWITETPAPGELPVAPACQ